MKVLVAGHSGYVGSIVTRFFESRACVYKLSLNAAPGENVFRGNLADRDAVRAVAAQVRPDVVIHAAGQKNITFCERNPDAAYETNARSVANLVDGFDGGTRVIYISTDYVFDGYGGRYAEQSEPRPSTVYGKSKLEGERAGLAASDRFTVIRLSALFDRQASFPRFLHESLSTGQPVECFRECLYSPTFYDDFLTMLERIVGGSSVDGRVFHCCGERVSRFEFARQYATAFGLDAALVRGASMGPQHEHLFPDLSMDDRRSRQYFGMGPADLSAALRQLAAQDLEARL